MANNYQIVKVNGGFMIEWLVRYRPHNGKSFKQWTLFNNNVYPSLDVANKMVSALRRNDKDYIAEKRI